MQSLRRKEESDARCGKELYDQTEQENQPQSLPLGYSEILIAEAVALRDGLHHAILNGHHHIQIEGDSKVLIDSILVIISTPWRIRTDLVRDIKLLAQQCST